MDLTEDLKSLLIETAKQLKGSARRLFLARTVQALGPGGASRAERELGWNRKTKSLGMHERESGITSLDAFGARGRKLAEEHLPYLVADIKAIVDGQSQSDPHFKTTRLYTPLTAPEVRRQLIAKFGYREEELPTATTIGTTLNQLGYYPTKVAQSANPKQACSHRGDLRAAQPGPCGRPERGASAGHFHGCQSDGQSGRLLARGRRERVQVKAADHDFKPKATVTAVGILMPQSDELFVACVTSKVSSDCLVEVLEQWWQRVRERYEQVRSLLITLDNGPEQHSHRTQFLHRLVAFAQQYQLTVHLAYSPPSHSKYNPIEGCWGILEQHWNGDLFESVQTVVQFAQTMTCKGKHPVVSLLRNTYQTGVRLSKRAMVQVEMHLQRLQGLERWFVTISSTTPPSLDT